MGFDKDQPRDDHGRFSGGDWAAEVAARGRVVEGSRKNAEELAASMDEDRDLDDAEKTKSSEPHNKFNATSWVDRRADKLAGALTNKADKEGGFSYRTGGTKDDRVPKTGFMVSVPAARGMNRVVDIKEMANRDPPPTATQLKKEITGEVNHWLTHALPALKESKDTFLGGWMERHEGGAPVALHLDVSQRFTSKDEAIKAGKARNQMAIWHLDKSEEISTGGTGR